MKQDDTSRIQQKGRLITVAGENCSGQGELEKGTRETEKTPRKKQARMSEEAIDARFWSKVDKRGVDECWLWKAGLDQDGYGQFSIGSFGTRSHRYSFNLHHGSIPDGYCVCHSCDTPACCNPAHLWLGTVTDNNRDMFQKKRNRQLGVPHLKSRGDRHWIRLNPNRSLKGEQQPQARLTSEIVKNIRDMVAANQWTQAFAARKFQVSQTLISRIIKRKCWRHI